MSSVTYSTETEEQTVTHNITWTIYDFVNLIKDKTTREFEFRTDRSLDRSEDTGNDHLSPSGSKKFQLKIQFLGRHNDKVEICYLPPDADFLKLSLAYYNIYKNEHIIAYKEYHTVQAKKWQYLATLLKCNIVKFRKEYLQLHERLILKFKCMVKKEIKVERTLSTDFENLLNNNLFSDIIMKSSEDVEFKVHKAVLAGRSAVLKAHFEHNTTECLTNIVESPLGSEVLREVLTFIYSDKAPKVDEIPALLLSAAEFYDISGLKKLCEEALYKRLTFENAIETLQLADLFSADTLKQLTLEFIKDGQANLITKSESWAKLKSVELIKSIYEYITTDEVDDD